MTKAEKLARWMHKKVLAYHKNAKTVAILCAWEDLQESSRGAYRNLAALLLSEKADKILGRKR